MSALARLFVVLAATGLTFAVVVAIGRPVATPLAAAPRQANVVAMRSVEPMVPSVAAGLLARSPFARDRGAYQRVSSVSAPQTPPPEVRLVAIFSTSGELRATLRIDGADHTVAVGDLTPVGVVTAIEPEAVEVSGETERRFGLFE